MKKLLCLLAMCAVTGAASATSYWSYQYTGFLDVSTRRFEADTTFRGSFRGTDLNTDGVLQLAELEEFEWDGARLSLAENYCGMYRWCELNQFSYDLRKGELHFDYAANFSDEAPGYSFSFNVVAGDAYHLLATRSADLEWVPGTRFDITPAPVPEPATAWMLGAGLTALGVAARRRRQD